MFNDRSLVLQHANTHISWVVHNTYGGLQCYMWYDCSTWYLWVFVISLGFLIIYNHRTDRVPSPIVIGQKDRPRRWEMDFTFSAEKGRSEGLRKARKKETNLTKMPRFWFFRIEKFRNLITIDGAQKLCLRALMSSYQ